MSHKPPVPGGSVSPYPLQAAQSADRDHVRHDLAEKSVIEAKAPPASGNWGLRVAAGSAIGSAAIAAALIFWNRSKTD